MLEFFRRNANGAGNGKGIRRKRKATAQIHHRYLLPTLHFLVQLVRRDPNRPQVTVELLPFIDLKCDEGHQAKHNQKQGKVSKPFYVTKQTFQLSRENETGENERNDSNDAADNVEGEKSSDRNIQQPA